MAQAPQPQGRAQLESLLNGQKRILGLINEDRPLSDILHEICVVVEAQADGMMASILLLDEAGECLLLGAAPSLPDDYNAAVHGLSIGPTIGSCGAAAYAGEPVIVEDIATHPNWVVFRALAFEAHGLRACWSTPIRSYEGAIMGTFAMYYREPKTPSLYERKLIDFTSHLVTIAVNRNHHRDQLMAPGG